MTIQVIKKQTDDDNILLKRFLKKVANGKNENNKVNMDRIGQLIMVSIHKTDDKKTLDYLWNLHKYLFLHFP